MRVIFMTLPLSLLLGAGPCPTRAPAGGTSKAASRKTTESLAAALRAGGFAVRLAADTISQPFFSVSARVLVVDEADLQVYEYPTSAAAGADAAKISPSGSPIGTSMPNWMRPPHIYRQDNLILIYLGDNPRVRAALEAQAGRQIAGAP